MKWIVKTKEEQEDLDRRYPPYEITEDNAWQCIRIMIMHGLNVTVQCRKEIRYDTSFYRVQIRDPTTGRYEGEDADTLSKALSYAFMGFCNHDNGAIRRAIRDLG